MTIFMYASPEYKDTLWCQQTIHAIYDEAAKKRYSVSVIDPPDIIKINFDSVFGNSEKRILIVLGTSINDSASLAQKANRSGVRILYINYQNENIQSNYSNIIVDYADSMRKMICYLRSCGRGKTALYGINRNSSTDMIKNNYFRQLARTPGSGVSEKDIYYNEPSVLECFDSYGPHAYDYNSVICANDVVAYSLMKNLRCLGMDVPGDCYIVSFGGSILSQVGAPALTTVSVDHRELGRQAVFAYSYLSRVSDNINISAKVEPVFHVRASTENKPYDPVCAEMDGGSTELPAVIDFYNGPDVKSILSIEHMLSRCDELDFLIMRGLLLGEQYSKLAEMLYTSENVISYRVKRMCKTTGEKNRTSLLELLNLYISPDEINKYLGRG